MMFPDKVNEPNRTERGLSERFPTLTGNLILWRLPLALVLVAQTSRGHQSLACLCLFPALALVFPLLVISHLPPSALLAPQLHPPLPEYQNLPRLDRAQYLPMRSRPTLPLNGGHPQTDREHIRSPSHPPAFA